MTRGGICFHFSVGRINMAPLMSDLDKVSDEDYLVLRAKAALKSDPCAAKAWMITAKTLFPNNFGVQFEAYQIVKAARHLKEAAKCFGTLFTHFQNDPALWQEVQALTNALRADNGQPEYTFLRSMFNHLSLDIQQQVLLTEANRSIDAMEHCRLLLLLLNRFPQSVGKHGPRLVDTLITAEHKQKPQSCLNPFRKVLVCDVLPLLGASHAELPPRMALGLIHKAVEFYMSCIISPSKAIQELGEVDGQIEDPWGSLFMCIHWLGQCLDWELAVVFSQPWNRESLWLQVMQYAKSHPCIETDSDQNRELIYCASLMLLRCLHEYESVLSAGEQQLVLVEAFSTPRSTKSKIEPTPKRRKVEDDGPLLTVGGTTGNSREMVTQYFLAVLRCASLLQPGENLRREILQFIYSLSLDINLKTMLQDVSLYNGQVADAITSMTQSDELAERSPLPELSILITNLRLAAAYYCQGDYQASVERALRVVGSLAVLTSAGTPSTNLVQVARGRHLHFIPLARSPILQYCVQLVLHALQHSRSREIIAGQEADLALGHMITLLQLELSTGGGRALFETLLEEVRTCSTFSYHLFTSYIINVDVLEEFMYLSKVGPVTLDILPPSTQHASQRRMSTRGADKGVKEDIKTAMRRQMARSGEPLDTLLAKFLTTERNIILHSIGRGK